MGMINEEFVRCTECNHPYFYPEKVVLIKKDSDYQNPIIFDEQLTFKCAKCGHKQYEEA